MYRKSLTFKSHSNANRSYKFETFLTAMLVTTHENHVKSKIFLTNYALSDDKGH